MSSMPPVTVHIALGGLIGAVLLAEHFDTRAILVVMGVSGVPDLDVFIGFVVPGAHRAVLHTLLFPALLSTIFVWDVYVREESYIRGCWGAYGVRVVWVAVVAMTLGHIVPDAFDTGINAFWPLHDQFYMITGSLVFTYHNGLIIEFVEIIELGTTADTHYGTGFDTVSPTGARRFPVAATGEQFMVLLASGIVLARRIISDQRTPTTAPSAEFLSED